MIMRKLIWLVLAATPAIVFTPREVHAWGACHAGYTHVGPHGVYHAGFTAARGPAGRVYGGAHVSAYGARGGIYHVGYAAGVGYGGAVRVGGYRYAPGSSRGYVAGGFRAARVGGARFRAGVYRRW